MEVLLCKTMLVCYALEHIGGIKYNKVPVQKCIIFKTKQQSLKL